MLFDLAECRPTPESVLVFASGANRPAEIRGFAQRKIPVGVAVDQLNEDAILLLTSSDLPVMVDSGAFSEVAFPGGRPEVVRLISDEGWQARLDIYMRLGKALGEKAYLVAPDQVGSQKVTLDRLTRYHDRLHEIASTGALLLLPLQVGELSHAEFYRSAVIATGLDLVPAMPMRKAATSVEDLVRFVSEVKPPALHLLGIGIQNPRSASILRAIEHFAPDTRVSMDSNRIRAVTGKGRPLTESEHGLRSSEITDMHGEVQSDVLDACNEKLDYTDLIAYPSYWAENGDLKRIAEMAGLNRSQTREFFSDPDGFLQSGTPQSDGEQSWIEQPQIENALDHTWMSYVRRRVKSSVRSAAIVEVFAA